MRQVHGNAILAAERAGLAGEGDGLLSTRPGLGLLGRSADCPLLLLAAGGGCGMAHASWRGTVKGVGPRLVEALALQTGANPAEMSAAIAPSAGPCCYEVGEEVRDAARAGLGGALASCFFQRDGALIFDLWRANREQLLAAGLRADRIQTAELCTICHPERFPSYRREGEAAGRFAAVIGWRRGGGAS
jgi:YfiH family protein